MTSSVARGWVTTRLDVRPIDVRAQEARENVWREIPPGHPLRAVANQPADEVAIAGMQAAVETYRHEKAAATAPDARHRAAIDELWNLKKSWNEVAHQIQTAQKRWLQSAADSWKHRLLRDVSADCFTDIKVLPMAVGEDRNFDTYDAARAAAKDLFQRLQWARGVAAQISNAREFDSQSLDQQAVQLVEALVKENAALQDRIENLEAGVQAIEARLNPPRKKRKIA